ncbi:hypothetical protein N7540_006676 [Penicillium herquei]|nr:hypothetical protein N7540_006676 [Penicillium herquei]
MQTRLPIISVPGLFDTSSRAPVEVKLPPKPIAIKLVEAALDGQILFSIIHRPSFDSLFNLVYSLKESDYSVHERRFLPLLYAVLAYGCLFADMDVVDGMDQLDTTELSGTQYYEKSRELQDIADSKDLISLQAVVFKILFLLVSSRVFTCYTYIITALSLVIRMGLHRGFTNSQNFISQETSKRVFWALWVVASDTSIICGLPMLLNYDLIDQESPVEVNDIYIEQERISQPTSNEFCYVTAANTYRRLQIILQDVTIHIYSENRVIEGHGVGIMSHAVSVETLKSLENDLKSWALGLSDYLKLGNSFDSRQILTTQFTLSIMYAHAQLYLYRPFLQHFMKFNESTNSPDHVNLPWLATLCIQACENVIMLCEDMYRPHRWKVMMTVMIATLPSSARHIQERLNDLETKLPDIELLEKEGKEADDSYTETLGHQALNLLNSDSSTADKLRWLPPHLLDAHGLDSLQTAGSLSPSWRMIPQSKLAMLGHIQEPYGIAALDPADEYLFDDNNELNMGLDPLGLPFGGGEGGFGNIDDFLGLQNWL